MTCVQGNPLVSGQDWWPDGKFGVTHREWLLSQFRSCVDVSPGLPLQWRHNGRDSVSNHQPRECLLSRLIRRRSKKISKLRVTGLCAGNSPETGEFPAQRASNAENVSIWWRHHVRWHSWGVVLTIWNHPRIDMQWTECMDSTKPLPKAMFTYPQLDSRKYIYQNSELRHDLFNSKMYKKGLNRPKTKYIRHSTYHNITTWFI